MAVACAAVQLAAMPTEDEAKRAEPAVQKLLEPERAALKSGKKTYSEVAVTAMKLVGEVDTDAEKLLLMKGAFVLYVLDGNFEKSVETMKALKAAIPDIPPQSVTNLIETALLGVAKKEDGARLYKLLDESNVDIASVVVEERNPIVPETATEKTRKAIAKLFPGWSLDTEVCDDNAAGIQPIIRGKRNVTCVHPKNGPSVISRTVKLSGNNPCLSLSVASWNDDADFQLSVRVNGKDALTNRVVCTTDAAPWEDIVVPLSAWRGSTAKIEVRFANHGRRWYEIPCLARVDIIEADGDMSVKEGMCEVDGYIWSYRAQNGEATIVAENDGRFSTAVSPSPIGNITIPATLAGAKVTHIGRDAFRDCSGLTAVTVPEGAIRIGRGAFFNCSGLGSITIPSSVKIIERDAFANCTALTSVSIPEGVTIIDRGVFYLCDGLGSIEIPSSVTRIGRDAFTFCRGLASVTIPEGVTSIGWQAFYGDSLKSITLPSSLKIIEGNAFCKCAGLQSVTIPEGVTSIDRGAFGWCFGLKSIKIPSSVTQIGREAFAHCRAVASVTIPGKVADIGPDAFVGWRAMATVTIPASVTNIDHKAFGHTGALTSFQVEPDNRFYKAENGMLLTKDGTTLVRGVNGDVTIPTSVTAIGPCAFEGCLLRSVEIPSEVKIIGSYAFKQCRGMKSVTIPSSVTDIGQEAFFGCKDLKSIAIPHGVTAIRNSTFSGTALTEVMIPVNVKFLERGAFSWCGELKSVSFPEGMTSIGRDAFYNCGKLTSLVIPSSVQRIEQGAFYGCGSLTSVTMRGERPNAPNNIFERCGNLKAIHVPANAKSWAGMKDWFGIPLVFDGEVSKAFSLNAAPGSIAEIDLGNVPPLQFVYCPAGKFTMGYKEQPAISKVKDIEITSPFWVSKSVIRADQLESLGVNFTTNFITNGEKREAWISDASIVVQKLPSVLKERFGKMLPPGYVFRLPTEAEFEYLQKAETKDGNGQTNIWGVERLYSGGYIGLLDRAPPYGRGVDVVNRRRVMTDLEKVSYENQPDKDPVGWSDATNWSVFRRGLARNCGGGKLLTGQSDRFLYGFYFVVAPDVDKLNKFYWK